jgi:menaquinone-dependent protoporphyrinogen oxidase
VPTITTATLHEAPARRGILILYDTREGQTRRVAELMADVVAGAGHAVEVAALRPALPLTVGARTGVVVAASIHLGGHGSAVGRWIRANLAALEATTSALLSVSLSAAQPGRRADAVGYVEQLMAETGWKPGITGVAAGALRYTSYGPLKRWFMARIARTGGLPTDTSRDHEFTDWDDIRRFVRDFLRLVHQPASTR